MGQGREGALKQAPKAKQVGQWKVVDILGAGGGKRETMLEYVLLLEFSPCCLIFPESFVLIPL